MIGDILLFGWVLTILAALSTILMYVSKWKRDHIVFPLQGSLATDVPYIQLNIQGYPLNMIVDTGAATSIIKRNTLADMLNAEGFLYSFTNKGYNLVGVEGVEMNNPVYLLPFSDQDNAICEEFAVFDTDCIANFNDLCNVEIHGILGSSFFANYDCVIDYRNHMLTVKHEKKKA